MLSNALDKYNDTVHSSTKMKRKDAHDDKTHKTPLFWIGTCWGITISRHTNLKQYPYQQRILQTSGNIYVQKPKNTIWTSAKTQENMKIIVLPKSTPVFPRPSNEIQQHLVTSNNQVSL